MDRLKSLTTLEPAKKAFSLLDEFKKFAFKGNIVDLAMGVIIGTAFGKVIESLVKNVIMPLVSLLIPGDQSHKEWSFTLGDKKVEFGVFLSEILNFVIVAAVLFLFIVKFLGWLIRAKQAEAAVPPLSKDQQLLTEIRDLLQKNVASPPPSAK